VTPPRQRRNRSDGGAEAKIENLNVTAGLAFGIGVVLLFIFATSNLLTGQ